MAYQADGFWLPKQGSTAAEYEDALFAGVPDRAGRLRCAVADGATESSYSGLWAQLLVAAYGEGALRLAPDRLGGELAPLRRGWAQAVGSRPLPWYAEAKLAQGAHAALLGFTLHGTEGERGNWEAAALGDCALVQLRGDRLHLSWPFTAAADFGSRPVLLPTRPDGDADLMAHLWRRAGTWRAGDRFLLMTDALAAWLLRQAEVGEAPWAELVRLEAGDGDGFAALVAAARSSGQMRNDDVTVVRLLPE